MTAASTHSSDNIARERERESFQVVGFWKLMPQDVKYLAYTHNQVHHQEVCMCVCVYMWWWGGGGVQDLK